MSDTVADLVTIFMWGGRSGKKGHNLPFRTQNQFTNIATQSQQYSGSWLASIGIQVFCWKLAVSTLYLPVTTQSWEEYQSWQDIDHGRLLIMAGYQSL